MKIKITIDTQKFSYDIYHLIQAFYPGAELEMTVGETPFGETPFGGISFGEEDGCRENAPDLAFAVRTSGGRFELMMEPGGEHECIDYRADMPAAGQKNQLKRLVYSSLVKKNGRTLPWGDLSGIRPVKLAEELLEGGADRSAAARKMTELYCVSEEKAALACGIAEREKRILSGLPLEEGYSLYINIPFCPSICLYCTFGSNPIGQWERAVDPYLAALEKELLAIRDLADGKRLTSVYIGGGTPTSIRPDQMDRLLAFLGRTFPMEEPAEFTVEAGRPDTITEEMLGVLRDHHVTRISINPQTMNQKTLNLIGRRHRTEDIIRAFALARTAGFDNINMDMIVGLPGEGEAEVSRTLEAVRKLGPDGFTVHSLALKRAARLNLFRDVYAPISFENSGVIMDRAAETATAMGMEPYYLYRQKNMAGNFENVGYSRPGCECLYNILVMEEKQTVLGAGCGAASKFIRKDGRVGRAADVKSLTEYLNRTDEMISRKLAAARASGLFL
ncbi:MAG: coproporphyrinogen dehydrogenase HemZ [Lachnospiraceae bacterium]|jgi:oxygen-independent coproporphyrinogen-3 oxidase|nr:coproporphyrinogen dehydrogenase HemZ [Lachnospiraceae bacterium]MCI1327905.1 coproporphyrinogen dehydrogenase HemZ [Lachnospiraceae bacterium]